MSGEHSRPSSEAPVGAARRALATLRDVIAAGDITRVELEAIESEATLLVSALRQRLGWPASAL